MVNIDNSFDTLDNSDKLGKVLSVEDALKILEAEPIITDIRLSKLFNLCNSLGFKPNTTSQIYEIARGDINVSSGK